VIETPIGDTETYIHGDTDTHRRHRDVYPWWYGHPHETQTYIHGDTDLQETQRHIHGDRDTHRRHRDISLKTGMIFCNKFFLHSNNDCYCTYSITTVTVHTL
jgi:hypothetical protein